eukprot:5744752-Prymnesium_polylepis.1
MPADPGSRRPSGAADGEEGCGRPDQVHDAPRRRPAARARRQERGPAGARCHHQAQGGVMRCAPAAVRGTLSAGWWRAREHSRAEPPSRTARRARERACAGARCLS